MAFVSGIARRALSTSATRWAIRHVTVVGGGQMGTGIAQVAAQAGCNVTMTDTSHELLDKGTRRIQASLSRVFKKKYPDSADVGRKYMNDILERIDTATDPLVPAEGTDLVVEAIVEDIDIKRKLFKALDEVAPPHAIFTSNTSSLPIRDIASATERSDRFGGLHFFNPVPVMQLVEVVRLPKTSDTTNDTLMEFCKELGKTPIPAKDTPGFIVNRLLVPYVQEAIQMVERGDARPEDIDTAMKLGCGYPMGPLQLVDYYGVDLQKRIIEGWREIYPNNPQFSPSLLLDKMVAEGKHGVKAGQGFYDYD